MRPLALIMAGGQGTRLYPLTRDRAKPAVPFGGKYRIVDFVLTNFLNSQIYSIYVLVQWRSQSLIEQLKDGWQFGHIMHDHFIIPVPAQMRLGETWYQGTADAIFQNLNLVDDFRPDLVAVFGADHVYRMDIQQMIQFHLDHKAAVTVSTLPVTLEEANQFGVVDVDSGLRFIGFDEKPANPRPMPGAPGKCLASMGNYLFDPGVLRAAILEDAQNRTSHHDFGRDLLPALIDRVPIYAYNFMTNRIRGDSEENLSYWRDVGTIEAYYEANMDLRDAKPRLNLYNTYWPLRTAYYNQPPAKFVFNEEFRRGQALHSVVSEGCIVSGGLVRNSILGRSVFVHSYSQVDDSVVMDYCEIGRYAKVRRAIIDKNVTIQEGDEIGERRVPSIVAHVAATQEDGAAARDATKQFDRLAGLKLDFKRKLLFYLMLGVLHAVSLIPDFVLYPLGIAGGYISYLLDRRHIKIGMKNLAIAFPERSEAERRRILRASYVNLGRSAAEYARLGGFFHLRLRRKVAYDYGRYDYVRGVRDRIPRKGVLILTAHFGSFELLPTAHAMHGDQISLVHHTQRFLAGDALMTWVRTRAGVEIVRKHSAARAVLRTLRQGNLVGVPFDQNAKRSEAVFVPFFGEVAATSSGVARLVARSGAAVVPVFIVRQPDGRTHRIEIHDELPIQRTGDAAADIEENTRRFVAAVEVIVRRYPEQFLWTHRRYRTRPRGTPPIYDV